MIFITNLVFQLHFITPVEHNKEIVSAQHQCYIRLPKFKTVTQANESSQRA